MNLLDNAVHAAGPAGEVRVDGRLDGGVVEIAVEDSGPGVDRRHAATAVRAAHHHQDQGHRPRAGAGAAHRRASRRRRRLRAAARARAPASSCACRWSCRRMRSYLIVDDNAAFAENLAEIVVDAGAEALHRTLGRAGAGAGADLPLRRPGLRHAHALMGGAELVHRIRAARSRAARHRRHRLHRRRRSGGGAARGPARRLPQAGAGRPPGRAARTSATQRRRRARRGRRGPGRQPDRGAARARAWRR